MLKKRQLWTGLVVEVARHVDVETEEEEGVPSERLT